MTGPDAETEDAEDPIDVLLSELLLVDESDRPAALDAACAVHPDLADELRGRWSALAALGLDQVLVDAAPSGGGHPERLGDFDIKRVLGGGGMGIVYLAEQISLGRPVALKVMRPEGAFFSDSRERFKREVEAIARLDHAGIVKVHSVGEQDGVPYFAMERIDGLTLAEVLKILADRSPASLTGEDLCAAVEGDAADLFGRSWTDACVEIGQRTALALHHAHEQGIVHRDVKPSNVAVTRDGRVQLFDFGLAASSGVDRLTRTGGHLGTLHYMPPEQLRGERELDARSDVYALGVTLYELLALQTPFEGDSRASIESRIIEGQPPPLRAVNRKVGPELERVLKKAMDLEPSRRYASAKAFAEDLGRILERRPVLAKPPGPILRARRWVQRNPARAVGLGAAVLLFVVTPSFLLWRERSHTLELSTALEAESEALRNAEAAFDFVEELFFASDPYRTSSPNKSVSELLRDGASSIENLEGLEGAPRLEGRLKLGLASALFAYSNFDEALPLARRALEIEDELGTPILAIDTRPLEVLAQTLGALDRREEGAALLEERLASGSIAEPVFRAKARYLLGVARLNLQRFEEAERHLRQALAEFDALSGPDALVPREAAEADMAIRWRLCGALQGQDRYEEALMVIEPTIDVARDLYPDAHPSVAECLTQTAFTLAGLGDLDSALDLQRDATAMIEDFYGATSFVGYRYHNDLTVLLGRAEQWQEGFAEAEETARIGEAVFGTDDPRTTEARRIVDVYRTYVEARQ